MPLQIVLLRAVNVGGNNKLPMAALRESLEAAGYSSVQTRLQSGNVVLDPGKKNASPLEKALEKQIATDFGLTIDVIVRTAKEWESIIAANPFPNAAKKDPSHLLVMCLKSATTHAALETLRQSLKGPEEIVAVGKQLYINYNGAIGTSKLTGNLIENKLKVRGTARNWNTVMKLASIVGNHAWGEDE